MSKEDVFLFTCYGMRGSGKSYMEHLKEKGKEIERLNNKNEELLTLYTTERNVKEDYKAIIKEVREYIEKHIAMLKNGDVLVDMNINELLEILDKENI